MSASLEGLRYDCAKLRLNIYDLKVFPAKVQRKLMRQAIKDETKRQAALAADAKAVT